MIQFQKLNGDGVLADSYAIWSNGGGFYTSHYETGIVTAWVETLPVQIGTALLLPFDHNSIKSPESIASASKLNLARYAREIDEKDLESLKKGDVLYVCGGFGIDHVAGEVKFEAMNIGFVSCTVVRVWEGSLRVGSTTNFAPRVVYRPQ